MKIFYIIVLLIYGIHVFGLPLSEDSSVIAEQRKRGSLIVISRVHTMSLFLYMGKVVNHNPAADLYANFSTPKGWGLTVFKAVDINDIRSGNNFAFAFISKYFHVGQRFTIAPYVGAGLEQQYSFANHGSDLMLQLLSSFKLCRQITIEYIGIFNNLVFATEHQDWTNRFRLLINNGHWDVIGMMWSNNGVFDHDTYTSGGASIFYNRVPVADRLYLGAGLTALSTFLSSDEEHVARQAGLQFSTTLTFK